MSERPDLAGYSTPKKAKKSAGPPPEDEHDPIESQPRQEARRRGPKPQPDAVQLNTKIAGTIRRELDELVSASEAPAWPGGPVRGSTMREVVEEAIHRLYVDRIEGGAQKKP